jgi:RNA polymerase sigma-70 factor (ECF subfamily)
VTDFDPSDPFDPFDPGVLDRARAGDPVALQVLLAAVRPLVLRYCRSRLRGYGGGLVAADDVAQDTCLAVLDVLPRYQHRDAPFSAFVYGIAAHKVADAQRGLGRAPVLVEDVPDRAEPSPTPEEQAVSAAGVRAAHDLLAQLPARARQVLLLRAAGLGADAVGQRLGMTANAVRVAQHRGVARLRVLVAGSEEHRELLAPFLRPPSRAGARALPGGPGRGRPRAAEGAPRPLVTAGEPALLG